jgi:hypothetical protein
VSHSYTNQQTARHHVPDHSPGVVLTRRLSPWSCRCCCVMPPPLPPQGGVCAPVEGAPAQPVRQAGVLLLRHALRVLRQLPGRCRASGTQRMARIRPGPEGGRAGPPTCVAGAPRPFQAHALAHLLALPCCRCTCLA